MIRNTLASNAQYTAMTATGTGAYRWSRRTAAGAKSTVSNHGNGTLPNVWVRVTRVGNTFTSFTSANGTTWTSVGSVTMTLNTNCFVGLYVASGSKTTLNTSRFVNVSVTP
jgi:regulation of enolase protein 1 (concanavalin A-like superfamily)